MNPTPPVDWPELHRRMEAMGAALAQPLEPAPADDSALLQTRARALGREPAIPIPEDQLLSVVEFELAGEHYAFPLAHVREVSHVRELTPVPCTPPFILGIINLSGDLRTVIDLKTFFHLPSTGLTELNKVLVLQHGDLQLGDLQLGVLADVVHGVRQIPLVELQPLPPTLTGLGSEYVRGLTREGLIVLAAEVILSDPRLVVEEQVAG